MKLILLFLVLALPSAVWGHGHSSIGELRTISEAYGLKCNSAMHDFFPYSIVSHAKVGKHGLVMIVEFPHSQDLAHVMAHIELFRELAKMDRWEGAYKDAHMSTSHGHVLDLLAKQRSREFRRKHQDACDHRRKER